MRYFSPTVGRSTNGMWRQRSTQLGRQIRRRSRTSTSTCARGSSAWYAGRAVLPSQNACTTWRLGSSSIAMSLGDPSDMASTALKYLRILLVMTLALLGSSVFVRPSMAQTCTANIPHIHGVWKTLPYLMPINPISTTLLNTGDMLIVAGSENDSFNNSSGAESNRIAIWDLPTDTTPGSITVQNIDYDVFCSGTAVLPDGRALVVGGTSDYLWDSSFTGANRASIFDPMTRRLVQSQSMVDGRWYATATALGGGRIMTFSGLSLDGDTNNTVEIYDLRHAGAGWTSPVTAPFSSRLYPRLFLLPNRKVFYTGRGFAYTPGNAWSFDPVGKTWTKSVATTTDRHNGSAVLLPLLPPAYTPKVMNFGG